MLFLDIANAPCRERVDPLDAVVVEDRGDLALHSSCGTDRPTTFQISAERAQVGFQRHEIVGDSLPPLNLGCHDLDGLLQLDLELLAGLTALRSVVAHIREVDVADLDALEQLARILQRLGCDDDLVGLHSSQIAVISDIYRRSRGLQIVDTPFTTGMGWDRFEDGNLIHNFGQHLRDRAVLVEIDVPAAAIIADTDGRITDTIETLELRDLVGQIHAG